MYAITPSVPKVECDCADNCRCPGTQGGPCECSTQRKETHACSPYCTCGCNEGYPCRCGENTNYPLSIGAIASGVCPCGCESGSYCWCRSCPRWARSYRSYQTSKVKIPTSFRSAIQPVRYNPVPRSRKTSSC